MRILFLDAYFEPEQIAFTHLEKDLLDGLTQLGHEVEIVCPIPTRGVSQKEIKEYRNRKDDILYGGYAHVTRFFAPQEGKKSFIRALRYFWCNLRTYQIGRKMSNVDAVFANSTPPTQGLIAGRIAHKKNIPFVYSLQDIFPDSLVTTGLTKRGSLLWKLGRRIENSIYRQSSSIIVISNEMKKNLIMKNVPEEKVRVISNWIDLDAVHAVKRENNDLFDEFGIDRSKYVVVYAGNFGAAQGAEIVLEVAEVLQNEKNIQFVVLGGGSGYLEAEKKAVNMPNVFIHPLLPQSRVSEIYSMGDIAIITCKKGVGKSGMPSKIWSIMACNTPIIASFDMDSELATILSESEAGVCVEPESARALCDEILCFYKSKREANGRLYIENKASKDYCVSQYIELFEYQMQMTSNGI